MQKSWLSAYARATSHLQRLVSDSVSESVFVSVVEVDRDDFHDRGQAYAGGAASDDGNFFFDLASHDLSSCWRDKSAVASELQNRNGLKSIFAKL
jgi:hypothetical protein